MGRGGTSSLAYVRIGLDRPLPLPPGRNVIAAGPSGAKPDRATGVERSEGGADVLEFELPDPADPGRGAPRKRKRRAPDPAGTQFVVTLVRASEPLDARRAASVLEGWRRDPDEAGQWVGAALAAVNAAVRAHRLVQRDPYAVEVTLDDVLWGVVGHAPADVVGGGGIGEQIDALGNRRRRESSSQRARPGEVTGLALTGGLALLEGEELISFAAREANHGRLGSAAAALEAGRRLLGTELDPRAADWLSRVQAPHGADATALLKVAEGLQDVVDHWRSGTDANETPDVVRAGETVDPSRGAAPLRAAEPDGPRR
ncbi:unannotated protein [freshwater metagenome]|uniref:Unannotated protein n=1 Tax=freshwater metagenome TaxID=449393 RepID=A0A6J7GXV6_9ZZZZ|nr:hypothetical protein [Actinomycetota bacterium]